MPEEALRSRDDSQVMAAVHEQLAEPELFFAKVEELYADPAAQSHDTLHFKDGRVFERDSMPQRIDGEIVGRVWSFRDVTEHRRLESNHTRRTSGTMARPPPFWSASLAR